MKFKHFAVFVGALLVTLIAIEKSKEAGENNKSDNVTKKKSLPAPLPKKDKKVEAKKSRTPKARIPKKSVEKKAVELSKRQQDIMKLFSKNKKIDASILDKNIVGVTRRTIRRDLDNLEELGLIKKHGRTKGAYYVKL